MTKSKRLQLNFVNKLKYANESQKRTENNYSLIGILPKETNIPMESRYIKIDIVLMQNFYNKENKLKLRNQIL